MRLEGSRPLRLPSRRIPNIYFFECALVTQIIGERSSLMRMLNQGYYVSCAPLAPLPLVTMGDGAFMTATGRSFS